jgi:polyhydroxybutyrate depolymerase
MRGTAWVVVSMLVLAACASGGRAAAPATGAGACAGATPGASDVVVARGGADHRVRIFVPSALSALPAPVVLNWHGLGSDGAQHARYSGYEELAEQQGFVAVHPTGVGDGGGPASWQLTPGPGARDDLAFADALIDELIANWCVDPGRIYSTGFSNGGFFTARLICERADRVAAAVSVSGLTHPDGCDPSRRVPYLAYHGTDDTVVPYDGGESVLLSGGSVPADLAAVLGQSIHAEFEEFAADAGCDPTPTDQYIGVEVIVSNYSGCGFGTMAFFEVQGGGHTWPGSPLADTTGAQLGATTGIVEATRDGWAYMREFTLD